MIEALAIIGGGTTAAALGAIIWLAYRLVRAKDEQLAARDRIEKMDEQFDGMVKERDGLVVELAAKTETLTKETALHESAKALLKEAFQKGVKHAVERVQGANIADANKIIGEIMASMPGPSATGVSEAVPEGRATAPGPDSLIDPFAVRTP